MEASRLDPAGSWSLCMDSAATNGVHVKREGSLIGRSTGGQRSSRQKARSGAPIRKRAAAPDLSEDEEELGDSLEDAAGAARSAGGAGTAVSHSTVEKRRRDRINTLIDQLAEQVPPSNMHKYGYGGGATGCNPRRPKHTVLSDTLALLSKTRQALMDYEGVIADLRARVEATEGKGHSSGARSNGSAGTAARPFAGATSAPNSATTMAITTVAAATEPQVVPCGAKRTRIARTPRSSPEDGHGSSASLVQLLHSSQAPQQEQQRGQSNAGHVLAPAPLPRAVQVAATQQQQLAVQHGICGGDAGFGARTGSQYSEGSGGSSQPTQQEQSVNHGSLWYAEVHQALPRVACTDAGHTNVGEPMLMAGHAGLERHVHVHDAGLLDLPVFGMMEAVDESTLSAYPGGGGGTTLAATDTDETVHAGARRGLLLNGGFQLQEVGAAHAVQWMGQPVVCGMPDVDDEFGFNSWCEMQL